MNAPTTTDSRGESDRSAPTPPGAAEPTTAGKKTRSANAYGDILKSVGILGSARGLTTLVGMARVKVIAVLLGPVGIGLLGTYEILLQTIVLLTCLGIPNSGVRQIAVRGATEGPAGAAKSALHLNRLSLLVGLLGTGLTLALAYPITILTFGSAVSTAPLYYLAPAVFFVTAYCGKRAILQGAHRIRDVALFTIAVAIIESIVAIVLIALFRESGVLPSFLLSSVLVFLFGSWLVQRQKSEPVEATWSETFKTAPEFVKLGLGLTNAILLSYLLMYATRTLVVRELGIEQLGIFLCAFFLSGKFIGFLVDSMRSDFYPRLSAVAHDNGKLTLLMNQQTEIVTLLAVPGLLFTLALAPWLIEIFYSKAFVSAADLLRLFTLGCLGRVIAAPMGYVRLAKGRSLLYFVSELLMNLLHLALVIAGLHLLGLKGVGIAYALYHFLHLVILHQISRRIAAFSWTAQTFRLLLGFIPLGIAGCVVAELLPPVAATGALLAIAGACTFYCVRRLCSLLGPGHKISRWAGRVPGLRAAAN